MATTLRHFENGGFTTSPFFEWRTNDATKPAAAVVWSPFFVLVDAGLPGNVAFHFL